MKLVYPSKKYLKSYCDAVEEYKNNNVTTYSFDDPKEVDVVKKCYNYRHGINLKPNHVVQTTFWLIDNDEFVGEIGIRHTLTESLLNYGGHIGYAIRFSKWNKGYGTKMLALALKKAKQLHLEKVLITCNEDNLGSAKVIENNGGVLENIVNNIIDGKRIRTKRYWIQLWFLQ